MRSITALKEVRSEKIFAYNNHALIIDRKYEPFLITKDILFFCSPKTILNRVLRYKKDVPIYFTSLNIGSLLFFFVTGNIKFFWMAVILGIFLIYIYFRLNRVGLSSVQIKEVSQSVIRDLSLGKFNFTDYKMQTIYENVSYEVYSILNNSLFRKEKRYYCNLGKLILETVKNIRVKYTLLKLDNISQSKFMERLKFLKEDYPEFKAGELFRVILLYSLEVAIETGDSIISPEHLFVALSFVVPSLAKVLKEFGIENDLILFLLENNSKSRAYSIFNPNNKYIKPTRSVSSSITKIPFITSFRVEKNLPKISEAKHSELEGLYKRNSSSKIAVLGDRGIDKSLFVQSFLKYSGFNFYKLDEVKLMQLVKDGVTDRVNFFKSLEEELNKTAYNSIIYIDDIANLLEKYGNNKDFYLVITLLVNHHIGIISTVNSEDNISSILEKNFIFITLPELTHKESLFILANKALEQRRVVTFLAINKLYNLSRKLKGKDESVLNYSIKTLLDILSKYKNKGIINTSTVVEYFMNKC